MKEENKNQKEGKQEEKAKAKPYTKPLVSNVKLIRILAKDLPGDKKIVHGLTMIKGISWNFSKAVCHKLKMDENKKIEDLTPEEIAKITEFVKNPQLPDYMLNRRRDFYSGENAHRIGVDLDLQREFDIKRLKKIKSYKGMRHILGQPARGQRTKSHFRKNKKASAGKTKKIQKAAKPQGGEK